MEFIELVSTSLEPLNIPVIYGWFDKNINSTHITFIEFDNVEGEYCDDEATTEEHWIQIDVWTKNVEEAQTLKRSIKKLLKDSNFNYQDGADQFEADTEIWHISTRWLYVENLE